MRRALFSGIIASLGASLGWLGWVAAQAFAKDWKVLLAPVLGAVLGFIIQWIEKYIHTARHEHIEGEAPPDSAPAPNGQATVRNWLLALTFLGIACEHLVGHVMSEYLLPFLASLATLFPAGFVIGFVLDEPKEEKHVFAEAAVGALCGFVVSLAALAVQLIMGGGVGYFSLASWWIIVGIGLYVSANRSGGANPVRTVLGVVISLSLVIICSIPALVNTLEKWPYIGGVTRALSAAVDGVLVAPDLPAQFWVDAERGNQTQPADIARGPIDVSNSVLDKPYTPPQATFAEQNAAVLQALTQGAPDPSFKRNATLRTEWDKGMKSGLVRSWIVLVLFAIGLGFAPMIEESLRPRDYPSSRTQTNDKRLAIAIFALILVASLSVRLARSEAPSSAAAPIRESH